MANVLSSPLSAGDQGRAEILREVMRVLKPGGSLVLKASWVAMRRQTGGRKGSSG
jgi:hypothetical protein